MSGLLELVADVIDVFLRPIEVTLLEFTDGFVEWLNGGRLNVGGLLSDFATELFGFVASLLELVSDFLGIAGSIACFLVDAFGEILLSACEVLKLASGFSGAVELGFAGSLEEFLFSLKKLVEIAGDFLLFLLQSLAFLGELLLEVCGGLASFRAGLLLLPELVGVLGELFGIECDAIEFREFLFELCGAGDFFDGAIEFIAAAAEFG